MSRLVATLGRICTRKKKEKKIDKKERKIKKKEELYLKKLRFIFVERDFSVRRALERNTWNKNSAAKKTL